jgi:hypothetical protein
MSNKSDISTTPSCFNKKTTYERTITPEQLQLIFNPIRLSGRVDLCLHPEWLGHTDGRASTDSDPQPRQRIP